MNKICRICLEEGVLSSIFARNYNVSLSEMIEYCLNIKRIRGLWSSSHRGFFLVQKDDGLPEQLCSNCIYKLGIAYHFKQTCETSDVRLRQYLGLGARSKHNDAAVMTDPISMPTNVTIHKCKCKIVVSKKTHSNYKKKSDSEKLKRGPKPKPKQVHTCYQCEKQFKCQAQLQMHIRTHTGDKPYSCMYCPRQFTQKHNLTIHLRIHTGEKPFQCEVCSKRFSAQGNLQTHLKIHLGQRDHVCSICNKSFVTSSELTRHMCKHRGVKGFKCDICGTAFVQSRDLKMHKQKKHQIGASIEDSNTKNKHTISELHTEENINVGSTKESMSLHVDISKPPSILEAHTNGPIGEPRNKHMPMGPYKNAIQKHTCAICSEEFDYLSVLAQHYTLRHENYKPLLSS